MLKTLTNIKNRLLHKLAMKAPGGYTIRPWLHRMRGVKIGKNVWISQEVYIDELHPDKLTIGDNCTIGLRTSIFTHFYWGPKREDAFGQVQIEESVFVGPHCVILPNVTIGEGSVIKAGSVISCTVQPHTFMAPPPVVPMARVTVPLTAELGYQEFLRGLRPIRKTSKGEKGR
jgi:acetyltransferase-like isoleucine patch superfamily enzyme